MTPLTPHAGDRREMRRRSEQPYIPHYKMCKPKITIDIIAAQNYYYMENLTPPSEVEFDLLTPRERALKEIQTEVTRTLSVVSPTVGVVPPTPHTKVADFLQVIG
ncbi:hypothetical protein EB796_015539 [Bugula neritina]|uniref:Uncharacterized protein n=1 Tax=Bugula neritina TaxID=10212 RepID=A0A7J7JIR0_BUGNE|nr:hypothetical protein EB796_015539 [Bugula neritina]